MYLKWYTIGTLWVKLTRLYISYRLNLYLNITFSKNTFLFSKCTMGLRKRPKPRQQALTSLWIEHSVLLGNVGKPPCFHCFKWLGFPWIFAEFLLSCQFGNWQSWSKWLNNGGGGTISVWINFKLVCHMHFGIYWIFADEHKQLGGKQRVVIGKGWPQSLNRPNHNRWPVICLAH